MPISSQEFRLIQARAVAALEREFGAGSVAFKGGKRGSIPEFKFTISAGGAQDQEQAERAKFSLYAKALHPELSEQDFGRTVRMKNRLYTICGCNPQRPKFSILLKRDDGKEFGIQADMVVGLLRAPAAAA